MKWRFSIPVSSVDICSRTQEQCNDIDVTRACGKMQRTIVVAVSKIRVRPTRQEKCNHAATSLAASKVKGRAFLLVHTIYIDALIQILGHCTVIEEVGIMKKWKRARKGLGKRCMFVCISK